jgi:hypothetical protein
MSTTSMSPEQVRALRGKLSRAAFAKQLGVTPHTVYRWELPADAKDARRPRGAELEQLQYLTSGSPVAHADSPPRPATTHADPQEIAVVLGAIERVFRDDWAAGRTELLRVVTQGPASDDARAFGASGLALIDVLFRSDSRAALAALAPVLRASEERPLSTQPAAYVHAAAAAAHAMPDATLFDIGRVHAHAARAEELAGGAIPEISFLAWLATAVAAVVVADDDQLARAFARLEQLHWTDLPPLLAVHDLQLRALRAVFTGQRSLAGQLNEEAIERARARGYAVAEARSLAMYAVWKLDDLAPPDEVLPLAIQSQRLARSARASAGLHTIFAIRAEGEALLRMGRTAEALDALTQLDGYWTETGTPPLQAVTTVMRTRFLAGRFDALAELAQSLRACTVAALRPVCRAYATMIEALHTYATSMDPNAAIRGFENAAAESKGWNFLLRDTLVFGCTSYLAPGHEGEARAALRRAQKLLDRFPSPWASAHLRRIEGALVAATGRWTQGRQLLEAAVGTFEAAGDVTAAALAKYLLAGFARAFDDPGAGALLEESRARLEAFGLRLPPSFGAEVRRIADQNRTDASRTQRTEGIERLVAPLARLAVRGADPTLVQRELVNITAELLDNRPVRLEELDSSGSARALAGSEEVSSELEWVEFGDGGGRRLRIGAETPVGADGRAVLGIIATAGGLALEVATLRSVGSARPDRQAGNEGAEIPGLVAASRSMRAVRNEIVHIAASRSTVVIQGESGTGKEVIARAIHDLSTRAAMAYVAFNCATVPRDLFEGQLFGYRKGAFTGATRDHPGVIRSGDGGTLFLDEIGELPLDVQPKLLRFLENGEIFPLGEQRARVVDVRVVAATHRDLDALVRERRFREDLYYRLQVLVLRIPPLRERREDIVPLTRHFLRLLSKGETPPVLAPDALAKFDGYGWPGNVRELRNVIERALAYSPVPRVLLADHLKLPAPLRAPALT